MMSTFVFVTWNGGGNLTPALGIARALAERRHTVAFLGEETQRRRIEAAGLAFTAYTRRPDWDSAPPQTPVERQRLLIRNIWMNDGLADDLTAVLVRSPADMVVVDCMLAGILANSPRFGVPTSGARPFAVCIRSGRSGGVGHDGQSATGAGRASGTRCRCNEVGAQGPRAGHDPARV